MESVVGDSIWDNPDYDYLPDVPADFPLQTTHVSVQALSLHKVIKKVFDCLKHLSIDICQREKTSLLVESVDHVEFYVHLYKQSHQNEHLVFLELQKMDGCSLSFFRYSNEILQAIQNCSTNKHRVSRERMNMLHSSDLQSQVTPKKNASSSWKKAKEMINDKYVETNILGQKYLLFLMDKEQVSLETALYTAGAVLQKDLNDRDEQDIRSVLLSFIKHPLNIRKSFSERGCLILHNLSFQVFARAFHLNLTNGAVQLEMMPELDDWMRRENILDVIIREISFAVSRPHGAFQSLRCLNALMGMSSKYTRRAIESGAISVVKLSQEVGYRSHLLLAQEADIAMSLLDIVLNESIK